MDTNRIGPLCYGIATVVAVKLYWLALAFYVGLNLFFLWPRHRPSPETNAA